VLRPLRHPVRLDGGTACWADRLLAFLFEVALSGACTHGSRACSSCRAGRGYLQRLAVVGSQALPRCRARSRWVGAPSERAAVVWRERSREEPSWHRDRRLRSLRLGRMDVWILLRAAATYLLPLHCGRSGARLLLGIVLVVRPVLDTTTHTYDTTRRLDGCTGIPAVPIENSLLRLSFVVIGAGNAEHARFHPFSPARLS
jgi:hypothetical protein